MVLGDPVVRCKWMTSTNRAAVLRLFGASIGKGGRIKNAVQIKFPWKLKLGESVWIGENVWIDNLEQIRVGSDVCISQGAYLCTGNHDWSDSVFGLKCAPIIVEGKAWIGAQCRVGPGVTIKEGAVLTLGAVAVQTIEAWAIYSGNPAVKVKDRRIRN
jgi:putative colanic acid biosynthesis acetyltransferase WcaF